jgi:hypothetical protein
MAGRGSHLGPALTAAAVRVVVSSARPTLSRSLGAIVSEMRPCTSVVRIMEESANWQGVLDDYKNQIGQTGNAFIYE